MRKKNDTEFIIVTDTREQKPYRFKRVVTRGLKSGDYSIAGIEDRVAVERKTKQDAFASLGTGRSRFENEVKRLAEYEYGAIVIETDLADFLCQPAFSQMNPKAAINSLVSWSVQYGVHIFFASDRLHAKAVTYRILEKFWKHRKDTDDNKQ